ncbi:MAG TPA: hypothetical protein PKY77_02305 [Phycisphaerae bacterium]|nr:hypothetical protein [Phycisphaerae bacterium]HRY66575.1 hypothetical protein [Phycisphaerae bacterium]HSA26995.1 hypothetical protein [Phycisphaerae bacterium]
MTGVCFLSSGVIPAPMALPAVFIDGMPTISTAVNLAYVAGFIARPGVLRRVHVPPGNERRRGKLI